MITNPNDAIIDLRWLNAFEEKSSTHSFIDCLEMIGDASKPKIIRRQIAANLLKPSFSPGTEEMYLLERLFEFDHLLIDSAAFEASNIRIPYPLDEYFKRIEPTLDVYNDTAKTLKSQVAATPVETRNKLGMKDFCAKNGYHDAMWKHLRNMPSWIADSQNSNDWIRAIFYLIFADTLGVTPLMSGTKAKYLNTIGQLCLESQHDIVSKIFDGAINDEFERYHPNPESIWTQYTSTTPPIMEHILSEAVTNNRPAMEVFTELREDPRAKQYRKLMIEMRHYCQGTRGSRVELLRITKALSTVAEVWATTLDFKLQISYVPRRICLKKIPLVGQLLELASMDTLEIRDYLLNSPPGYLMFASSWYINQFPFGESEGYV